MTIAVIGAGMAGLAAARALQTGGQDVRLFDKGRGPGGRMATRRTVFSGRALTFDHGAQYFTARSLEFRSAVEQWVQSGHVAAWSPRRAPGRPEEAWYVGQPSMNAMLREMTGTLDVSWSAQVTEIPGGPEDWWLQFEDGLEEGPFTQLIFAVPAEQASVLLAAAAPQLAAAARSVRSLPCWTAMLAFDRPLGLPIDVIEPRDATGPLAWAACNSMKPGRAGPEAWIVQASADWSERHLEEAPEAVANAMAGYFCEKTQAPRPDFLMAHRWRYARVSEPLGKPCLNDPALGIATCGDWHLGARVEAAWLSGQGVAEELLR